MPRAKMLFAVIEVFADSSAVNREVSHWYYDNINDANALAQRMQSGNPEFRYLVLNMVKGR